MNTHLGLAADRASRLGAVRRQGLPRLDSLVLVADVLGGAALKTLGKVIMWVWSMYEASFVVVWDGGSIMGGRWAEENGWTERTGKQGCTSGEMVMHSVS